MKYKEFEKLREREAPTFANINLLGPCNVDCYFCLGKDIDGVWSGQNQIKQHFSEWPNFEEYLELCKNAGIKNLYITGQNTDALMYRHLSQIIDHLQDDHGFDVGLRTNGYLAPRMIDTINKCRRRVGYSIHSLTPETNHTIMRRSDIPDWRSIIPNTDKCRVSIVLNRYNEHELPELLAFCAEFPNIAYVQVRRICTDTREDWLHPDTQVYERVHETFAKNHAQHREFYNAPCYTLESEYGEKEVVFWRTVKTSIGSFNYYTDGSYTDDYFVIEGYQNNGINYPKNSPVEKLEGYWRSKESIPLLQEN